MDLVAGFAVMPLAFILIPALQQWSDCIDAEDLIQEHGEYHQDGYKWEHGSGHSNPCHSAVAPEAW